MNNQFSARNPVSNPPRAAFPPFHQNQFGGVVGGPVYLPKIYNEHGKTFFFFGYQRQIINQKSFSYSRVPTPLEPSGDFRGSLFFTGSPNQVHLYDPTTTTGGAQPTRLVFAGVPADVIPAGRIDSLVVGYLKYILPAPNFTPTANFPTSNRLDPFLSQAVASDYSIRIDHRISTVQNSYNIAAAYGISDVDRTHILAMEATYQLPFGRGKEFLRSGSLAYIAGSWQINAIGRANSGRPIVLSASGDPANIGNSQTGYARPDLIGNPTIANRTAKKWFNTAAFAKRFTAMGTLHAVSSATLLSRIWTRPSSKIYRCGRASASSCDWRPSMPSICRRWVESMDHSPTTRTSERLQVSGVCLGNCRSVPRSTSRLSM